MFKYCPNCGSTEIIFLQQKVFNCPACGLEYYHNICAATGLMIVSGGKMALLKRAKEPALGLFDLPGGFVDIGEGVVDGLLRECGEEIGWIPSADKLQFCSSFANVYPYKNYVYNTCDVFFSIEENGLTENSFKLQESEVSEVQFIELNKINFDLIAFSSAKKAIRSFLLKIENNKNLNWAGKL
ncbi:MAG: NUDIX domain-containing protein [Termitinemataceae bacterium]|nr:MAG: NUDIX domain-containing protein [Termitinemataceae bacterium]